MTKTLTRIIGEGTVVSTAGTFVMKGIGLVTIFIVLHSLSVYEYGLAELAISVMVLASVFLFPGLQNVVTADMGTAKGSGDFSYMHALYQNFFFLQLVFATLAWAFVFFGADVISLLYREDIALLLKIISFSFFLGPFRSAILIAFRVNLCFKRIVAYRVLEESIKLALTAIALLIFNLGLLGVIIVYVLTDLLALFIILPLYLPLYLSIRKNGVKEKLPFFYLLKAHGKWGVFTTYAGQATQAVRTWLIQVLLGAEAVGLFAVAFGLMQHLYSLFPLGRIMAPIIPQYAHDKQRFYHIINKGVKYNVLGYLLLALFGITVVPFVVVFLFPHYSESIALFRIMLISLFFTGFVGIFTHVFYALKKQQDLFGAYLSVLILVTFLTPLLILQFGIYGVAFEIVITSAFLSFERYRRIKRILPDLKLSLRDMLQYDSFDRVLLQKIKKKLLRS